VQAGNLYRDVMKGKDRDNLIGNIVDHLGKAPKRVQLRQTALFYKADPDYGRRVAEGLGLDRKEIERLTWLLCLKKCPHSNGWANNRGEVTP